VADITLLQFGQYFEFGGSGPVGALGGSDGEGHGGVDQSPDEPGGIGRATEDGIVPTAGAAGGIVAPHFRQNRMPSSAGVPHRGQTGTAQQGICVI
jgi:hypothetical protein